MNFVTDEDVDHPIVEHLRDEGHTVWAIVENAPGCSDEEVLEEAVEREAILITGDKDFGDMVFRRQQPHSGIVLLRLEGLKMNEKKSLVFNAVSSYGDELEESFTVVTSEGIRIRSME